MLMSSNTVNFSRRLTCDHISAAKMNNVGYTT